MLEKQANVFNENRQASCCWQLSKHNHLLNKAIAKASCQTTGADSNKYYYISGCK
jgi:hypothetical protein